MQKLPSKEYILDLKKRYELNYPLSKEEWIALCGAYKTLCSDHFNADGSLKTVKELEKYE